MPAPRPSQNTDAEAAARQAEFNEKKWVWVPDEREGYLAGWVVREEDDEGDVVMAASSEIRRVPLYALSKMNPPKFDRVDDIADLTFLNEASVVHNLRLRYGSGAIYTYSGLFLVAVNPYQNLPLYSDSIVHQYRGKRRDENPPHIFAIAERAWINMGEERENQSILITGESGAGKTESTKKVIQYLAAIATDAHPPIDSPSLSHSPSMAQGAFESIMPSTGLPRSDSFRKTQPGHSRTKSTATSVSATLTGSVSQIMNAKGRLGLLERQILQANPILEAFGNAQTQRNNNSSRFGKFIRISFSPDGSIAGANIDWYLLEKSRVIVRSEAERCFHVFYQLMEAGGALKGQLLLDGGVENYEYLNKSRREVDGIDDHEEWRYLKQALDVVGFTDSEQYDLFRIVAAILHIGNIQVTSTRADDALMPDTSAAERACHLLGIPVAEFIKAVLRPRVLAGREWVTQARTKQQAVEELGSLCKTLYEKSFGSLVDRVNRALDRPSSKSTFIGVLDIAGFEIFDVNGYEQLLINYTNERLQQFFNHHMFVLEQEEYAREGIEWNYMNFGLDLQPTIELIEATGNTIGVLSCLDEECIMPKATDLTFTNKLHSLWAADPAQGGEGHPGRDKYEPSRFDQGFLIQHYAGKVEYRTDGWLEKNKDPLNDNLTRVMSTSSESYVAALFADYAEAAASSVANLANNMFTVGKKRTLKKGAFRTVAQRHKEQLGSLMGQLQATQPHFVRCIVPNPTKKPGRIDVPLVLDQLRCNGVLEGIRIARLGYPNRLPFVEFRQRYELLTPSIIPRGYMDGRKACLRMVDALDLDKSIYKIGTSKIFFKAGVLAELEERRDMLLYDVFSRFQAMARKWSARRQMKKVLNRAIAIRTIQRNAKQYNELREWPWWQLYTKVRPLLAATRNDEELHKRELELVMAKERAERDQKEKEALESLKMRLEADKKKIESDLEAERALGMDKDDLLERSKRHEAELEEEVRALQSDLDILDSQLDRVLKLQKEADEKHEALKEAFDQAAEHLVRLEAEQKNWGGREVELVEQLNELQADDDSLRAERDSLQKQSDELKNLVLQKEEDINRSKERMEATVADLTRKLNAETSSRDMFRSKVESLEQETRHTKEQLSELTRTATDYSSMLARKEESIDRLEASLEASQVEKSRSVQEVISLRAEIDTLAGELEAQKTDRARGLAARQKLQTELDELRTLLAAKHSDDARRSEVEKSMEVELNDLRRQTSRLQEEASDARRQALEGQTRLKAAQDSASRELSTLQQAHRALADKERDASTRLSAIETEFAEVDKVRRSMETELLSVRSRQMDLDGQLSETLRAKDVLEKQVAAAQARHRDFEDALLTTEREKGGLDRQLEVTRKELDAEVTKRTQLEKAVSSQRAEIATLKDRNVKLDRELNQTITDKKNLEWANKQLISRQDKTIVEHVHVLEEAKRVTDRQLADARLELEKQTAYIRSLEKAKARLAGEAEDLARQTEREQLESQRREKAVRTQEERVARALAEVEAERRAREAAELQTRRLQADLTSVKGRAEEMEDQLSHVQRAKENLEAELVRLADETPDTGVSLAKMQRQYESRITSLEEQLRDADMATATAAKIRDQVARQHAEIRKLIMSDNPRDETFRQRLLRELESVDKQMENEMKSRSRPRASDVASFGNGGLTARSTSASTSRTRKVSESADIPGAPDRQSQALRQQLQVLELQMATSDRVRQHLESCLREMTVDLENSDGSKAYLEKTRTRILRENARLAELLEDEANTRRGADNAQLKDVQAMWAQFKTTIAQEQESYSRLEESRKALLVQQRQAQMDVEEQRRQLHEMATSRKQLQDSVADLQDRLDVESQARNDEASAKRQLQLRLQELEISASTSNSMQGDLSHAVESFKEKANAYQARLEEAEIARAKSSRAEAHARRSLSDAEKALAEAVNGRQEADEKMQALQLRLQELESRLDDEGRDSNELAVLRERLTEEIEDERRQHQQDIEERDQAIESTQKRYQVELNRLMEELQSQRDNMSRLREENRTLRSDYDDLQLRYEDEIYSGGAWKKDRERLDTKISDLSGAYETSMAAQSEQQAQIVALHGQVRELRSVLDEAEADRALLQKARRALQAELEGIKHDHADAGRMSSATEMQKLQLRKQDLERSVEEHRDKEHLATDRMKKAEVRADEAQVELGRVRVENSELEKQNATLEKKIKEFQVRIVDLETKSYQSSPRPGTGSRRMESRIAELTDQLSQTSRDKSETVRAQRAADKGVRDAKLQLAESDRLRTRMEEEMRNYESKMASMRQSMAELETSEGSLQLAHRRAEREAQDYKAKALSLEREVERLRNRLDRPASTVGGGSPTGSPRKLA